MPCPNLPRRAPAARALLHVAALLIACVAGPARADALAEASIPLQAYLDGHATGREAHFRRAFAPDAVLIGIRDGVHAQRSAEDYIRRSASGVAPPDEAHRSRRIVSLTVNGDVATGIIELDYPDMHALDHMSLLRRDGEWRIVAKVYDARPGRTAD